MGDVYDRERIEALISEGRKLTAELKVEASAIRIIMDKAFDDDEVEPVVEKVADVTPRKFNWWFWR